MSTPQPPYEPTPQPAAAEPGKGLSIAAIIFAFLVPIVGLILGIVAMVQSKKAGRKNGLALASVIIGALLSIGWIIFWVSMAALGGGAVDALEACRNGASSVEYLGQTLPCDQLLASQ